MATAKKKKKPATFNLGDTVKILRSGGTRGRISELRGPLGPGGAQIYRVQIRRKPKAVFVEVREDQLEKITSTSKKPTAP